LVYPGAHHTRFHHALGAMHLMDSALRVLIDKGVEISKEEFSSAKSAILLHDIGHGPFSHALENFFFEGPGHEAVSKELIHRLNLEFDGKLTMAEQMFNNTYPRPFFHQLVSGQLDVDRLDYLKRDSFFTGVEEGNVNSERIIKLLNVDEDQLVVEEKGIYSIEKFLVARRLMYLQVYYHKTVIASEFQLIKTLERARHLSKMGENIFGTDSLIYFLKNRPKLDKGIDDEVLETFIRLDDADVMSAINQWNFSAEKVLKLLSNKIINRKLNKIIFLKKSLDPNRIIELENEVAQRFDIEQKDASYFIYSDILNINSYPKDSGLIKLKLKSEEILPLSSVSSLLHDNSLHITESKNYISYPVELNRFEI
jgi:HD superfamily phosphohydrolase